jgi:MFS transporter, DHA3 family, macrolide efflux protein
MPYFCSLMTRNRNALRLLLTANAVSGLSQGISMLAIPWYFARNQQSPLFNFWYGIITLFVLAWGLYAGTLIDRFNRKMVFFFLNLACALLVGWAAWYGYSFGASIFSVVMVFAVTMLNYNVHYPALYALSQELSEADNYQKVNSNIEVVGQTTSILSGGLAAMLLEGVDSAIDLRFAGLHLVIPFEIERWPIQKIFAVDAITYVIACLLILFMRYKPVIEKHIEYGSIGKRIRSGFGFLRRHTKVLLFGLFSYSVFAILIVEIHAVLPVYVNKHLQMSGNVFAIAATIYAVGAVMAGLLVSRLFQASQTRTGVIILTLVTAAIFYWCAATRSAWILYTISVILGFTNAGIRVLRLTYIFHHVPNELIGRVNSIFNMANVLVRSMFIFIFSAAFFQQGSNITIAYAVLGSFALVSGVVLWMNRERASPG